MDSLRGRKVHIATPPSYPSKQAQSVRRRAETDEYKRRSIPAYSEAKKRIAVYPNASNNRESNNLKARFTLRCSV